MHSFQRSFPTHASTLAPGHPYPFTDTSRTSCTVHYTEFRGMGPPSPDFGTVGDVYIDLNSRMHALYWCDRAGNAGARQWRRWLAVLVDRAPLHRYLVAHPWARNPETSDLFLWADPGSVSWTSKDAVCASRNEMTRRNIAPLVPGVIPDVAALISQILHWMLEGEQSSKPRRERRMGGPAPQHPDAGGASRPTGRYPIPAATLPLDGPTRPSYASHGGQHPPDVFGPPQTALPGPVSYEERCNQALDGMQRALKAEQKSKQELRLKARELASVKKKEKEAIGMSYLYQKREQELVAALAAAEQRSSAELQEIRATTSALQRKAQITRQDTQSAIEQVRRSEEELAAIQREISNLQSRISHH
ncbi:hypothetical protein FB45DRAFT_1057109 [Roridomyces roridus]|uniref:Uncharacterized protein n=1 Tax=Roridomyces roridus TaxID=1738132 RepID=A0AAD7FP37_9AGAR|nr:hypothetical protein FB45DRAFT_1057109 [Roridomyces roridus]